VIGIRCEISSGDEVIFDETVAWDDPSVHQVGKSLTVMGRPISIQFTFDPPLVTELPLGPDEQPSRERR